MNAALRFRDSRREFLFLQTLTRPLSLSERERVNHSAALAKSLNGDSIERDRKRLPLLEGEGRGEGEYILLLLNGYGFVSLAIVRTRQVNMR